jgi:serine/threonine-protein kinase
MNAPVTFGVGTVVAGTYEVTALLGQGGMGAVFVARHLRLPGKRVALKVLHQGGKDGEAYARFRREAEIVSRIGHPNIVEVLDFNTLPDGTPYLVLELLTGESLGARLAHGPLPVESALELLRQMGSALQAAHRAGVVHRDMKPENVFLCPSDAGGTIHERVKVLDFGISKIRGSQTVVTQDSVLIGTPQYMAPEQALGRNQEIDARADQFALGCILYEMLAGRPPFSGEALATVIYSIVHQPHEPLAKVAPRVPRSVAAAVDRALAKRPDDRFRDIGAFIEGVTGRPLETLRGADGAPAPAARAATARPAPLTDPLAATAASAAGELAAPPASAVPTATARRSPAAAIVVAVMAVAGVGAGVYFSRQPSSDRTHVATPPAPPVPVAVAPPAAEPKKEASPAPPPPEPEAVDPDEAKPGEAKPGEAKPGEAKPGEAKPAAAAKRPGARGEAALPAEVAAELAQADEALARGNAAEALRLAQHSLYAGKSSRAFAIMVKARCRQKDLGGARAALAHVGAQRSAVLKDCAAHGMDLR